MGPRSPLPSIALDGRLIVAVLAGAALASLYFVDKIPDPLAGTFLSRFGWSGIFPLGLVWLLGWVLLTVLRRTRRRQRTLSFLAGLCVGLVPFLFYWLTKPWWANPAPLASLAGGGLIAGIVLGAVAWWYVPYSAWVRATDREG